MTDATPSTKKMITEPSEAVAFFRTLLLYIATRAVCGVAYRSEPGSQSGWSPEFTVDQIGDAWTDHALVKDSLFDKVVTRRAILGMNKNEAQSIGFNLWDETLVLLPLYAIHYVEKEGDLVSITGRKIHFPLAVLGGKDYNNPLRVDLDVRGPNIAYGFETGLAKVPYNLLVAPITRGVVGSYTSRRFDTLENAMADAESHRELAMTCDLDIKIEFKGDMVAHKVMKCRTEDASKDEVTVGDWGPK